MSLLDRVAAAPISWGVCEVPGWGHQLAADQVLASMRDLGFTHTEIGPTGFFPTEADALIEKLDSYGLKLLGGFVPFVLHDPDGYEHSKRQAKKVVQLMADSGAEYFVSCAVSDLDDWHRPELDSKHWQHLYKALGELEEMAVEHGLTQAFHPHVNTIVERSYEVEAILDNTEVSITLDTAHLALGGADPLELAEDYLDRVALVHLKDINSELSVSLEFEEIEFMQAVSEGLFPPLGQGSLPLGEIIATLEASGQNFWYTLEQDGMLSSGEDEVVSELASGVSTSLDFLRGLR